MKASESFNINSSLNEVRPTSNKVIALLEGLGLSDNELLDIRLCLEELLINAIKYGNKFDKSKKVKLNYDVENNILRVIIKDEGGGFDYQNLPDPTVEKNLQELKGRGVFLVKRLMDEVYFNDKGNEITIIKRLNKGT